MSEKTYTDLPDVLASLKSIVADGECSKEVAVSKGNGTLVLAPSCRVAASGSDYECPKKKSLEQKNFPTERITRDADCAWEPNVVGQEAYDENSVTWTPLEEIANATNEDTSIDNKGEADDCVEQFNEGDDFQLSIDCEALKPIVADIIRKELQGVLGENITNNIRSLVRREIELAINNISHDQS